MPKIRINCKLNPCLMEQSTLAFITEQLAIRKSQHALRQLEVNHNELTDFCSNDYLGFSQNPELINSFAVQVAKKEHPIGASASRLISGHYIEHEKLEKKISSFHQSEDSLHFNSGYDANLGLFSCIPQKGDTIIYDQYAHASIRDGIRLSHAKSFSFAHNDTDALEHKLNIARGNIFVVVESIYSMDGDEAPLQEIAAICKKHEAMLIVDEAHSVGIYGKNGAGLCEELFIQDDCFARVMTYGKAMGTHGAAILCSHAVKQFLVNYSRPFIYTTAMDHSSLIKIDQAYDYLAWADEERAGLKKNIVLFSEKMSEGKPELIPSRSPIQSLLIPGNEAVSKMAQKLRDAGFLCKAIRMPTVPKGAERIRVSLHSYNSAEEIEMLCKILKS